MTCIDCGTSPAPTDHAILLVQSMTFGGVTRHWQVCSRCFLRRAAAEKEERRAAP